MLPEVHLYNRRSEAIWQGFNSFMSKYLVLIEEGELAHWMCKMDTLIQRNRSNFQKQMNGINRQYVILQGEISDLMGEKQSATNFDLMNRKLAEGNALLKRLGAIYLELKKAAEEIERQRKGAIVGDSLCLTYPVSMTIANRGKVWRKMNEFYVYCEIVQKRETNNLLKLLNVVNTFIKSAEAFHESSSPLSN